MAMVLLSQENGQAMVGICLNKKMPKNGCFHAHKCPFFRKKKNVSKLMKPECNYEQNPARMFEIIGQ